MLILILFCVVVIGVIFMLVGELAYGEFEMSYEKSVVSVSIDQKWTPGLSLACKIIWPRSIRIWREFDLGKTSVFAMPGYSKEINKNKLPFRFLLEGQNVFLIWAVMFFLWPFKVVWNILFYSINSAVFFGRILILAVRLFNPFRERVDMLSEGPEDFSK